MVSVALVSAALVVAGLGADEPPASPAPPCSSPQAAQFDFWLGDWEVRNADGSVAGESRISKVLGGCVVREEWTSAGAGGGYLGFSLSSFQSERGGWRQTFVDNTGRHVDLTGGSAAVGKMSLNGEVIRGGRRLLTRLSWEAKGTDRVLQVYQTSDDGGASWKTAFELHYARRAPAPGAVPDSN